MQYNGSKVNTVLLGLILIVVIALGVTILRQNENPVIDPETDQVREVILGQEFTLQENGQVTIKDWPDATFKLTGFYYHPCPQNANCSWSGLDVFYEMRNGGRIYKKDKPLERFEDAPWVVIVKDSDYETYAKIVLQQQGKHNNNTSRPDFIQRMIDENNIIDKIYKYTYQGKTYYYTTGWEKIDGTPEVYTASGERIECNYGSPMVPNPEPRVINPICEAYTTGTLIYNRN